MQTVIADTDIVVERGGTLSFMDSLHATALQEGHEIAPGNKSRYHGKRLRLPCVRIQVSLRSFDFLISISLTDGGKLIVIEDAVAIVIEIIDILTLGSYNQRREAKGDSTWLLRRHK